METTNRTKQGSSRRSLALLAVATGLGLLHHADHVLRADHSGWPFTTVTTPFTYSLSVYAVVLAAFLLRSRPLLSAAAVALMLAFTQFSHVVFELPIDQYATWATGVSHYDSAYLGNPNLLGVASPLLGVLAAGLSILLSVSLLAAVASFVADALRGRRPATEASLALAEADEMFEGRVEGKPPEALARRGGGRSATLRGGTGKAMGR